ncbi:hypothetical protein IFM89_012870 [Coptis chinensis]|uniref:Peptide N-acetyl-beta-D-glucosaminyl asparaginase amidase A N-terminal domain-containing protein n=1 Tax=Coptis chinensis TaxID=261450 RepID=A0A835HB64_9MAGN|nr:hypothetical protein IFM89_012870 [Coptis chinensis]
MYVTVVFLLFSFSFSHLTISSHLPDHYSKSIPTSLRQNISNEYIEITKPLSFNPRNPTCSLLIFQHDFANTIGSPPTTTLYSPPSDCPAPWAHIILEFRATCKGEQYDRIVGIWLDSVEILRTSTAEPTESGIFWKVRKDVTRYSSLFSKSNLTLTVMLENVVNEIYTGIYHVNVSVFYYGVTDVTNQFVLTELTVNELNQHEKFAIDIYTEKENKKVSFEDEEKFSIDIYKGKENKKVSFEDEEKPADLIIPISSNGDDGCWFRIQNETDVHSKEIEIPVNTYKAVLEIYMSFHGNDEFWYSNPPNSYIEMNNLTTSRGNGAFREVFVMIDGVFVGFVLPFPVIFTGGINPLFWEPVVSIGAFDLPSYDLDLSPFLGLVLDGKSHIFGIGVTESIPFWLVDANLHLWLDSASPIVMAKSVVYRSSALSVKQKSKSKNLDGSFEIKAERKIEYSGWVSSSIGNLTTHISQEFNFKNLIKFKKYGQFKEVEQMIRVKTEVKVESDTGDVLTQKTMKSKYPLRVLTSTQPGVENDTYLQTTNVSHAFNEESSLALPSGKFLSSVSNSQVSGGWMLVQDHSVLSGTASTNNQTLVYKDEAGCYSRNVFASDGKLLEDGPTLACTPSL